MTDEQRIAYLALDIETTGLDPHKDQILEVAWKAVDESFTEIEDGSFSKVFTLTSGGLARLTEGPEVVRTMHSQSGLLGEVLGTKETLDRAVTLLDSTLFRLHREYRRIHLLGMSIHFDAEFMKIHGFAHLFNDDSGISHRMYDITSIKLALSQADVPFVAAPKGTHRAASDVEEALTQASIFADMFKELRP